MPLNSLIRLVKRLTIITIMTIGRSMFIRALTSRGVTIFRYPSLGGGFNSLDESPELLLSVVQRNLADFRADLL